MRILFASLISIALLMPIAQQFTPNVSNPHKHGTLEWARKQHEIWNEFEKTKPVNLLAQVAGFMTHVAPMARTHVFSFDGSNDYVEFGDVLDKETTDNFSICTWLNFSASAALYIVGNLSSSGGYYGYSLSQLGPATTQVRFQMYNPFPNGITIDSATSIGTGVWAFVCAKKSSGTASSTGNLYINSTLETSTKGGTLHASNSPSNTTPLYLGTAEDTPTAFFSGKLAEVAIYNKALSQAEISEIYISRFTGSNLKSLSTAANLELWSTVNPPSGSGSGGVKDLSGNGYNGTLNGASIIADRGPFR